MSPKARIEKIKDLNNKLQAHSAQVQYLDPVDLESHTISKQVTAEHRYWYYIEKGVNDDCLSKLSPETIQSICSKLSSHLVNSEFLAKTFQELLDEIKRNHQTAIKKCIVDYILLDPKERLRLKIPIVEPPYSPATARAPVPWHLKIQTIKFEIQENLFTTNPVMCEILKIFKDYSSSKVVDMTVFTPSVLPITVHDFQLILKNQCLAFKSKMLNEWIPTVASMFLDLKNDWYSIVTTCDDADKGYNRLGNLLNKQIYFSKVLPRYYLINYGNLSMQV
jgi:dynein heavy chain